MKLSNLVLVFGILITAFSLEWGMKNQLLQKASYTRFTYNQLADHALEDGLDAGTANDSSSFPYVDEQKAVQAFRESLLKGFGLTEDSLEGQRLLSCIACVVIMQNQYFSVITEEGTVHYPYRASRGTWNIDFNMDGTCVCENQEKQERYEGSEEEIKELFSHFNQNSSEYTFPCRNQVVTECIEEKIKETIQNKYHNQYAFQIDFPDMEEEACHTLQGIGMLGFMQYQQYEINGYTCSRFSLSGARLVYTD
ncbi:MAG: hypothetical protein HFI75_11490 [Lachnospiraceae bacterium]|nr:hypothetical protein [Lachnospiraceae bacterium]